MAKKEKPKSASKERQKKVVKEIMENNGTSISAAMRKAGYSKNYSKNPQSLVSTKSWQELMEQYLPDELLTKRHRELLDDDDSSIRLRSVDLGYKIKNKFEPAVLEHIIRNYEDLSDEELEKLYHAKANKRKKTTND